MVALVQVLISIMLIPVAFAAPSVNVGGLTSNHSKSDPNRRLKVSPDGRCGRGTRFGCKPGSCCSKSGICGTMKEHCGFGCQKLFGSCNPTSPLKHLKLSPDGKCGRGTRFGCESGSCCSHYGICGTMKEHCDAGCQKFFGSCDPTSPLKHLELSPDGSCGRGTNFKCRPGNCCSQFGFCGDAYVYCGNSCQTAFGLCDSTSPAS